MHKKWETLRQCILEVTEKLHILKANRVCNKYTGETEVSRMTFEQIIDLTACDTALARAVGFKHVCNELIVNGGGIDEGIDTLRGYSALLNVRYIFRNMKEYFSLPDYWEYVNYDEVDHFWFDKEEETFKNIQSHLVEWRKVLLRHADSTIELQHYDKMMADRQAEHAVIVERRLKVQREMDRIKFAETSKVMNESILRLVEDRMKAEKEAAKAILARGNVQRAYNGSLLWRVEQEDLELRRQEKEGAE